MIAFLRGQLREKNQESVVLDVNGVGYLVRTLAPHNEQLELDEECAISIHTTVREDDISLYGFPDSTHKQAFLA